MDAPVSGEQLLRLPVRVRGIDVGHAVDLILDPQRRRVLGFDVLCRDDEHRFLPLTAAAIDGDEIAVSSALTLLAEDQLAFYRRRASTMRMLRGADVHSGTRKLGALLDVVVQSDGAISGLVVANGRTRLTIEGDEASQATVDRRRVSAA